MSKNVKNKNHKNNNNSNNVKKSSGFPLLIAAVAVLCLAAVVILLPKGNKEDASQASSPDDVQVIEAGSSLRIPVDEVTSDAQFYPVEIDGTRMEIIAVRDSDGNIRTAFNTCQICYSSGRGYYVQDGDDLVCQNCGNHFTVDQVEIQAGGCNPWPIFAENKTVNDEFIEISYDFLNEAKSLFANWKVGREKETVYQSVSCC